MIPHRRSVHMCNSFSSSTTVLLELVLHLPQQQQELIVINDTLHVRLIQGALLLGLLELVYKYHKELAGVADEEEEREVDVSGQKFESINELIKAQAAERAARRGGEPKIQEEEKVTEVSETGYGVCFVAGMVAATHMLRLSMLEAHS